MLKFSKNELIKLANEGKNLWDLYEILQVTNERDYNEYIREVFGNDYVKYNIFNDQVNLNHTKYRVLNNHSTDSITSGDLVRMLDEGKNKIDFMRLFCVITTNKLYKEIKKIFGYSDDIKGFENFKKRLIKNTKNSFTSTDTDSVDNKDNFVYLYALDYLTSNIDNKYFNIPSDKDAYILNISYYLQKFGDCFFTRKLMNTYHENKNINFSSVTPITTNVDKRYSEDIELLINTAIYLKRQDKIPIIVTNYGYNYIKCLSYGIYFCSEITDTLEEEIRNKKTEDFSLPYECYDSYSILNLLRNDSIEDFISDTTSNKVIFSCVFYHLLYLIETYNFSCEDKLFKLITSMSTNSTFHFVLSFGDFSTEFDKANFINNVLFFTQNLAKKHPKISVAIASEDLEILEYTILNKM